MDGSEWDHAYAGDGSDPADPDPIVMGHARDLRPGRALDLGCGAGGNAIALAERGWKVLGIDFAPKAIASAKKIAQGRGVAVAFEVADAADWEPPSEFDLVISNALPPANDRHRVLATATKALAPGGTLFVAEWDRSMADAVSFWVPDDLITVDDVVAELKGLTIDVAETIVVEPHEHGHGESRADSERRHDRPADADDREWLAVFVRAHRP